MVRWAGLVFLIVAAACHKGETSPPDSSALADATGADACVDDGAACIGRCDTTATNNCGVSVTCSTANCPGVGDVCTNTQCCTPDPTVCNAVECGELVDSCGVTYQCAAMNYCRTTYCLGAFCSANFCDTSGC